MKVAWLSKRHYTHKDALAERFGRIYQLPLEWAASIAVQLELVDYYGSKPATAQDGALAVFSTPVRSLRFLREMARRISDFRPDIIVASGDCFVGLLASRLARRTGARFVFDVYDDYREFGAYRAFLGWDAYDHLLRGADMVLYASRALGDVQGAVTPWHLVPNGVDPAQFRPKDIDAARALADMPVDGTRLVGYFGGMEPERGSDDLIAAVGILNAENPSVRLVLCGKGIAGQKVDQPWVDYRGRIEHSRIPAFINACNVVVLPYRRGPIIDMASSCKIAEYLFCARPLVSTQTPNLMSNFPIQAGELGAAICRPGDPIDLARAISYQLQHSVVASRPETHTWAAIAQNTLAALHNLSRSGIFGGHT